MNININEFSRLFDQEYSFLYDHDDAVAGYGEAVAAFDEFLKTHASFVGEFVRFREDYISSDRESAAFMFALSHFS